MSYVILNATMFFLVIKNDIYRATLRVSAVFAVARCPSVRLSRSCIVSKQLKISSNFFLGPVAPSF